MQALGPRHQVSFPDFHDRTIPLRGAHRSSLNTAPLLQYTHSMSRLRSNHQDNKLQAEEHYAWHTTVAQFDALENEWNQLHSSRPGASVAVHFQWMRSWWRIYGPTYGRKPCGLRILSIHRGSQLLGLLPIYESISSSTGYGIRRLGFIGTGEDEFEEVCPDYLDLLHRESEQSACQRIAARALAEAKWDFLELSDLSRNSPLLRLAHQQPLNRIGRIELVSRGDCPIANLQGGFECYLQRLSSNSRQQFRRLLKEGEKARAVLEIADRLTADEFFDDLVRLHQQRWLARGKPGCFAAKKFLAFHRLLVEQWIGSGQALLARLSRNGRPVAVLYGFILGAKFDFYQSGVLTTDDALRSPGNLAHLILMRNLSQRGINRYDFLRGSSNYKERLATETAQLSGLRMWNTGLRASLLRSSRAAGAASRKALKWISPRHGSARPPRRP